MKKQSWHFPETAAELRALPSVSDIVKQLEAEPLGPGNLRKMVWTSDFMMYGANDHNLYFGHHDTNPIINNPRGAIAALKRDGVYRPKSVTVEKIKSSRSVHRIPIAGDINKRGRFNLNVVYTTREWARAYLQRVSNPTVIDGDAKYGHILTGTKQQQALAKYLCAKGKDLVGAITTMHNTSAGNPLEFVLGSNDTTFKDKVAGMNSYVVVPIYFNAQYEPGCDAVKMNVVKVMPRAAVKRCFHSLSA
jgi:hypothetical protein